MHGTICRTLGLTADLQNRPRLGQNIRVNIKKIAFIIPLGLPIIDLPSLLGVVVLKDVECECESLPFVCGQMFGFHKPKMYRSLDGCCICRAKSSSSRFTDSKRYEKDFTSCFG